MFNMERQTKFICVTKYDTLSSEFHILTLVVLKYEMSFCIQDVLKRRFT
jgi:hypothetical protein